MNQNDILVQTDELADLIMRAPEIEAFHDAERALKAHPQASRMMAELRDLQEQVGDFQARRVPPKHYVHLLQQTESLLQELETIPEVVQFQEAQERVNQLLQSVTERLAQAVLSRVPDTETT